MHTVLSVSVTKPIGKGTHNLTVNISVQLRDELGELATKSGMRVGEYVRSVLMETARKHKLVKRTISLHSGKESAYVAGRQVAAAVTGRTPSTPGQNALIAQQPKAARRAQGGQK